MKQDKTGLVGLIGFTLAVAALPGLAEEPYRIAFSKSLGVEVFAVDSGKGWCQETLQLRLNAADAALFKKADLQTLLRKLSSVIGRECPSAKSSNISGYGPDAAKLTYQATASANDNWTLHPLNSVTATEDKVATSAPKFDDLDKISEPGVPPGNMIPADSSSPIQTQMPTVKTTATTSPTQSPVVANQGVIATPAITLPVQASNSQFKVNGWSPQEGAALAVSKGVTEVNIKTRDGLCAMRSDAIDSELLQFVTLEVKDVGCRNGYLHGKGKAEIVQSDGKRIKRYTGYFSQGYFTGRGIWETPFMQRFRYKYADWLNFMVQSDPKLGIHFVGFLHSQGYANYGGCSRLYIGAITENENLFINGDSILALIQTAGGYVRRFCPQASQFEFLSNKSSTLGGEDTEDGSTMLFRATATFDRKAGSWTYNPDNADNGVLKRKIAQVEKEKQELQQREAEKVAEENMEALREQQEQRKAEQDRIEQDLMASADYARLQNASLSQRVAYLHGVNQIDNPATMAAASLIANEAVAATVFVQVTDVEDKHALAEWPSSVNLVGSMKEIQEEGWYVISGLLDAKEDKMDAEGLLIPSFSVERVTACKKEYCDESKDILGLVRQRYKAPNWTPTQRPPIQN